jgi:hypothetical protein
MSKPAASRFFGWPARLALFFVLSLNHLHPLLKDFFTQLPYATIGDVRLTLAILYSDIHKLSQLQFAQLYHLPFLFPLSHTVTIGFTMFGQALLLLPFFLFGEPNIYPLYNGLVILSYLAAGWGAYRFFLELQDDEFTAVVAACLYLLLPFRVYNIPHLNLLLNFPIPFSLFHLLRYLKGGRRRDLLLLNAHLLCQFLFDLSHGFFLSISLALMVLIFVLIRRPRPWRSLPPLFLSLMPTVAAVLLVHLPFLRQGTALSTYGGGFDPGQYFPALSFFVNKSSLLLWLGRQWDAWPFFLGFTVVIFYFFAFRPHASRPWQKALLWAMTAAYALPGLLAVAFPPQAQARMQALAEAGLAAFFLLLAASVIALRRRLPLELKAVSWFLLALLFITFQPFPRVFDLFDALSRFLPFLHRSRGLRTAYIVPLALLGVFAFGFKAFRERCRPRRLLLGAVVLLLLAERLRWPVTMAKLPELDESAQKIYSRLKDYPAHYGLLELPFVPTSSNMYSLFTRHHDKHTYHGHYLIYDDPLQLEDELGLRVDRDFSGLADPLVVGRLRENGLYLIMIGDSFIRRVYDGDVAAAWLKARRVARDGLQAGLFREVKEERRALLIVIDDRRSGRDFAYPLPYFALAGKNAVHFTLHAATSVRLRVFFNDRLAAALSTGPGQRELRLPLAQMPIRPQLNVIRVASDQPVAASGWKID